MAKADIGVGITSQTIIKLLLNQQGEAELTKTSSQSRVL